MATQVVSPGFASVELDAVDTAPFPASSKQAAGLVNGTHTDVSSISFSDKILISISQGGRLSQWIQVPFSTASPTTFDTALSALGEDMLPQSHLSPKTLMGGGGEERETLGHFYATQIASLISTRNPEEGRTLVVGLGLQQVEMTRETFFDMMELLQKVL